jgi:hypothetical protein
MQHVQRRLPKIRSALVVALVLAGSMVTTSLAHAATTPLSQGKPATASSSENAGAFPAQAAVDGDTGTRWSSAFSDPQWLQVDLGATASITQVVLNWEAARAATFKIQVSANGTTWTDATPVTNGADGTQTLTVNASGRYVRMDGLTRATVYGYSLWEFQVFGTGGTTTPPTGGTGAGQMPDSFWGDTSSIPAAKNVLEFQILNRTNGVYPDSQVYWSFNGQTHSIAEQPFFDMPANSSGRMYFYVGSPNSQYFDFIEFTIGAAQFNGNTTRVDAFGLKLAMRLHNHDGSTQQVGEDYPTFTQSRQDTFNAFQSEVPTEFKHLATATAPYRILAPGSDAAFRPGGQYQTYMSSYAATVGVNSTTQAIFGCGDATLSANAALCAALNRHTADLPASQQQTVSNFYRAAPANYYAKFWHDHAIDHLAYGFPYDDVTGQSTYISHANPQWMQIAVGF